MEANATGKAATVRDPPSDQRPSVETATHTW
jgi:hypothetical protein